jgi:hypothetical protein
MVVFVLIHDAVKSLLTMVVVVVLAVVAVAAGDRALGREWRVLELLSSSEGESRP